MEGWEVQEGGGEEEGSNCVGLELVEEVGEGSVGLWWGWVSGCSCVYELGNERMGFRGLLRRMRV